MGRHAYNFVWLIFIPAILLLSLGLVTLLSLSPDLFYAQLVYALISILGFFLFMRIDFDLYHYLDRIIYVACMILLAMTFLGSSVRGSVRWITFGPLQLQPSELIKPFFLVSISSFLVRFPPTKPKWLLMHLGLFLIPFLLIFKQPDLGNAIVYLSTWVALIMAAGLPLIVFALAVVGGTVIMPLGYRLLHEYQRLRIQTFINPLLDPRGAGYNAIQAMIAVGSGQLFGRGFGRGTQTLLKFLPEFHTDFIFASFTEEFGFMGGFVLLLLFFVLLWQLLQVAQKQPPTSMSFLYLVGFFTLIFTHVIINIGMNMGVVPITGITLPFVSSGGSSLLSLWVGLGIVFASFQKNRFEA